MRVLVACEFSGIVRDAFTAAGHEAWSCDLLPTERPGRHLVADVRTVPLDTFDLLIAHPPCTYLARSGARWWADRQQEQADAIAFCRWLFSVPVPRVVLENPVGALSRVLGRPAQIVQPWMFGHAEVRKTCLWLRGLPLLQPTRLTFQARVPRVHWEQPGPDRWMRRSRTDTGLAEAMAAQWGSLQAPGIHRIQLGC